MNWKVGDIAILIDGPGWIGNRHLIGCECEILSLSADCDVAGSFSIDIFGFPSENDYPWASHPQYLKPLPPPNEVTSWDECIWKPKELVRVEIRTR